MKFEFATAGRIVFGPGTLRELEGLARELGQRALIVTGRNAARAKPVLDLLHGAGISAFVYSVPSEPTTAMVQEGIGLARKELCDLVIGFGGGSAIDTAKSIAVLVPNQGDLFDFLEVIGAGKALTKPSLPCIAIPTTAGTGSEVTRNAVLTSLAHKVKVSLRSPFMLPRVAIVDPELTYSLPPEITAATGLDALTQLIEPFVSSRANPLTDALCREAIPKAARSLRTACQQSDNKIAREEMSIASLFGGLALANAGLGAVHGYASPMGGLIDAPHGAICAALLPHVMAVNLEALRQRSPKGPGLKRYDEVAQLLTSRSNAHAEDGIAWVRDLVAELRIPGLASYGFTREHIAPLVEKGAKASSMKANPILLTNQELAEILERAINYNP